MRTRNEDKKQRRKISREGQEVEKDKKYEKNKEQSMTRSREGKGVERDKEQ